MDKPQIVIEYDSTLQACSWTITPGFPIKDMIHAMEMIKAVAIKNQLAQMDQKVNEAKRVLIPLPTNIKFDRNGN